MRSLFDAELESVGAKLTEMAERIDAGMRDASAALLEGDVARAEKVIAEDVAIDALEDEVTEQCVLLIAQQQPVGADLRTIIVSLRIAASLERMGDLAQHVAEIARRRYPDHAFGATDGALITKMSEAAIETSSNLLRLLKDHSLDVAEKIMADDETLDELNRESYAYMLSDGYDLSTHITLDLALLSRFYERFGDHAVGVSKRIVYLVTGDHTSPEAAI